MATEPNNSQQAETGDPRVSGIATVGWITLAALAICIPLIGVLGRSAFSFAIPLAVIVGSGLMAVRIWSSGEKLVNQKENEALKEKISDLEERLASLEMIDSLEAHFAAKNRPPEGSAESSATMGPRQDESAS